MMLEKTDKPAFLDTAGWVCYKNGDYKKAIHVLSTVIESAPETLVYQYHLGMAYLKAGDKAAARQYLAKAVAGDTRYDGIDEARETLKSVGSSQ